MGRGNLYNFTRAISSDGQVPTASHPHGQTTYMCITHKCTWWTTCLLFLVPSPSLPQRGPGSALWLIRRMPQPNQSVIDFQYGSNLDDKMSGRIRASFGYTHVSSHEEGTVALYKGWTAAELWSLLEEECYCIWRGEPKSPNNRLSPSQHTTYTQTHTHTQSKVYNHPTHFHTCAGSFAQAERWGVMGM